MCQYSSIDGCPSKWHFHHLQNLIETGVGSLVIESTAVSKIGRITPYDLCLYNNLHLRTHRSLINYLKKFEIFQSFYKFLILEEKGQQKFLG